MRPKAPKESLFPRINTLRFKISILYVAVIGLILILFQAVLYLNYAHSVSREFDAQLQMKAEQIGGAVNTFREMLGGEEQALTLASQKALNLSIQYPQYAFMPESPEKFWLADAKKLGLDKDYLVIMDAQGGIITSSDNVTDHLLLYLRKIGRSNADKRLFYKVHFNGNILRIIILPYNYAYKQGYMIAVGTSYGPVERVVRHHLLFIIASTLLFLVIASLIVRVFVIRVLSSVMEISNAARNIGQENLNARIRLTHADQEIQHLTGSLNEMIARLEKSFAHVKEFSLEMAHEVKTPLAIISGESQAALRDERTSEEYKEAFGTILKEAKRTQRFVSDLLLLTKLDYRLIQLRFEHIDLTEFLQETCEKMQHISVPKGVMIQQDISRELMLINGDKVHLRRVFFNLIDNALKFTPQGGRICILAERIGPKAVVAVSDTGCGIARDEISIIFNKFYRGLGLNIAHSIILLHGGVISVQSELGEGTIFKMEFPIINI